MFLLNWRLFEEKEEWLWRVLTFEHIFFWQKNCCYKISSHHTRIVDRCNNKTKCFKNAFCIFLISLVFKVFLQSIFSIHNLSNSFRRLQKHMWCNIAIYNIGIFHPRVKCWKLFRIGKRSHFPVFNFHVELFSSQDEPKASSGIRKSKCEKWLHRFKSIWKSFPALFV